MNTIKTLTSGEQERNFGMSRRILRILLDTPNAENLPVQEGTNIAVKVFINRPNLNFSSTIQSIIIRYDCLGHMTTINFLNLHPIARALFQATREVPGLFASDPVISEFVYLFITMEPQIYLP